MTAPRPVSRRGFAALPAVMAVGGTLAAPSWPVALLALAVVAACALRVGFPIPLRGRRR